MLTDFSTRQDTYIAVIRWLAVAEHSSCQAEVALFQDDGSEEAVTVVVTEVKAALHQDRVVALLSHQGARGDWKTGLVQRLRSKATRVVTQIQTKPYSPEHKESGKQLTAVVRETQIQYCIKTVSLLCFIPQHRKAEREGKNETEKQNNVQTMKHQWRQQWETHRQHCSRTMPLLCCHTTA